MQGFTYLVAAYIIAWVGLFAYLAVVMLRIRGVHTELAAVEELVREQDVPAVFVKAKSREK